MIGKGLKKGSTMTGIGGDFGDKVPHSGFGADEWSRFGDELIFGFDPIDIGTVKLVQGQLNTKGYGPLTVDGLHGPKTGAAIKQYQLDQKMSGTGVIDDPTLSALGLPPTGKPIAPEGGKAGPEALAASLASVTTKSDKAALGFFDKLKQILHLSK